MLLFIYLLHQDAVVYHTCDTKMLLFIIPVTPRCCCLLYLWHQDSFVYFTRDTKMLLFILPVPPRCCLLYLCKMVLLFIIPVTPRCCCLLYLWLQDAVVYFTHDTKMLLLFFIPVTPRCCCLFYLCHQDAVVYHCTKMLVFTYLWHQDAVVYYTFDREYTGVEQCTGRWCTLFLRTAHCTQKAPPPGTLNTIG